VALNAGSLLPEPDWNQLDRERNAWRAAHPPTTYQEGLFELSCLGPAAYEAFMDAWDGEPETLCAALDGASTVVPLTRPDSEPDDIADWLAAPQQLHPRGQLERDEIHSFGPDVPPKRINGLIFRTAREFAEMTADDVPCAAAFLVFGAITELDGRPDAAGTPWPGIVAAAAAKCAEIGARILIVDTLPQFAGLRGDTENNAGHALEAIEPLQLLAAKGTAIMVTRHDRKGGGEVGESARGSGAFTGAVDIVVALGRDSHDPRPTMRRLISLSRFTELPSDLIIELVDGRYVVLGSIEDVTTGLARDHVLAALPDPGEDGLAIPALVDALGESEPMIRATLNELRHEVPPRLTRSGAGHKGDPYRWSKASQDGSGFIHFASLPEGDERNETPPPPASASVWSAAEEVPE
jgi:hypothetical protein